MSTVYGMSYSRFLSIVTTYLMPQGVEHYRKGILDRNTTHVTTYLMPQGVEHDMKMMMNALIVM